MCSNMTMRKRENELIKRFNCRFLPLSILINRLYDIRERKKSFYSLFVPFFRAIINRQTTQQINICSKFEKYLTDKDIQQEKTSRQTQPRAIIDVFFHLSRSIPFLLLMSSILMLTNIEHEEERKKNIMTELGGQIVVQKKKSMMSICVN